MEDRINYKKIARYLAGECTHTEARKIEKRMENDPDYAGMVQEFQKIWGTKKSRARAWDIEGVWERINREMEEKSGEFQRSRSAEIRSITNRPDPIKTQSTPQSSGMYWVARIAAILMVVALTSLFTVLYMNTPVAEDDNSMKEVVMEHGQRATIHLDDGSRVRLNSGSTLRHPEEFNTNERSIHLSGEAYFEIAHNGRPFFVHTDEAVVEVLGTEFNVQAYEEENIEVVVADGKVAVRSENHSSDEVVNLVRGDMASLRRGEDGIVSVTRGVDVARHLGWLEYRLNFDNTPMNEVTHKLERWYGVNIEFNDPSLAELKFSATFEDESIHEVLRVIEIALDLNHEIEGRSITFFRNDTE